MTKLLLDAVTLIIRLRKDVGVHKDNLYVFGALTKDAKTPLRGTDAMRNILKDVPDLHYPERIRTRELRKLFCTLMQLGELNDEGIQWVADHLGHSVDVHKEFYRLHDSSIELTKVARLLLSVDEGNAKKFNGRRLSEITIEGLFF